MVLHKPGVSAGLIVPEGGEGPCRYVVGLVGPHKVWRRMARRFPCECRTGPYRGALCVLVLNFVESSKTVLEAIIVLDVLFG